MTVSERPPVLLSLSYAHPRVGADERAALAISERSVARTLASLDDVPPGLALVSTCLRLEIVTVGATEDDLVSLAHRISGVDSLPEGGELRSGRNVVHHLFRVASGLCSPVIGEPEILGQVRHAHRAALEAGTLGPMLDMLFREAINAGRAAHDLLPEVDTGSIAAIAADHLVDMQPGRLALVGAGAMANAVAARLEGSDWTLVRITRRPEHVGDHALGFEHLEDELVAADVALSAVTAPEPLLRADLLGRIRARRHTPLPLIDLGMPANVDTADLRGFDYQGIDDLARDDRHRKVTDEVEAMIDVRAYEVHARMMNSALTPMIKALREKAERAADEELARAFGRLRDLDDSEREVIEQMARTLANRLLHDPLSYLSSHPHAIATSSTARDILGIGED